MLLGSVAQGLMTILVIPLPRFIVLAYDTGRGLSREARPADVDRRTSTENTSFPGERTAANLAAADLGDLVLDAGSENRGVCDWHHVDPIRSRRADPPGAPWLVDTL